MNNDTNDDLRQNQIPAVGETDRDEASEDQNPDPQQKPPYQDDLDYRDSDTDPIINEENDNPAEQLGIPEEEFRDELNKYDVSDIGEEDDDMRETIEDRGEDDDNAASTA